MVEATQHRDSGVLRDISGVVQKSTESSVAVNLDPSRYSTVQYSTVQYSTIYLPLFNLVIQPWTGEELIIETPGSSRLGVTQRQLQVTDLTRFHIKFGGQ